MLTFNIHEAKTHLSKLVENAANGESFIIAKSGKPMVKVTRVDAPEAQAIQPIGFMSGQFTTPANFDNLLKDEVLALFGIDK